MSTVASAIQPAIHYHIAPADLSAHLFHITLTVDQPAPEGQILWLPVWIPGSYLIREFARNIVAITAHDAQGKEVLLNKLDKHRWQAAAIKSALILEYDVYAFDLSVRGAYLDETRGFFNGTSVFLAVAGQEDQPVAVELASPPGQDTARWQLATSLPVVDVGLGAFGRYRAANYDELIDHPVEMGEFSRATFTACGVLHEIVIAGRHRADLDRLQRDLAKICEYQIKLFGEPAPFDRYVFMTMVTGDGYGGLEHRASTSLLASRDDLPLAHEVTIKPAYRQYLGLCSHEYFHSWNVKRIKPASYAPYDLARENYTRLLWAFEGITSYYDDLTLVRTGLISQQEYLDLVAQTLTSVERGAGRQKQNLAEASFDAWVKYYRQDENSPNVLVSYYTKGALVALCLDLTIRSRTGGQKSLDDVMRALWQRYGRHFDSTGQGVAEDEWEQIAIEVAGFELTDFFDRALRSTDALPVAALLASVGVQTQLRAPAGSGDKGGWKEIAAPGNSLGAKLTGEAGGVKLAQVFDGGAARVGGLCAGDILIAWDGLRVSITNIESLLGSVPADQEVEIHAFRRDELIIRRIKIQPAAADTWGLKTKDDQAGPIAARNNWLSGT